MDAGHYRPIGVKIIGGSPGGERPDWDAIYAHLITVTGWTWDYIDDFVTLPRLYALNEYWIEHPPIHLTMAAFAGIKPQKKGSNGKIEKKLSKRDFQDMIAVFGAGPGRQITKEEMIHGRR